MMNFLRWIADSLKLTDRYERGARLLDRRCPGWYERIDITKLDMKSGQYCVLGQLFGSFMRGLRKLGIEDEVPYGFNYYTEEPRWSDLIVKRRGVR